MARTFQAKRPENLRYTLKTLFAYLGRHRILFLAVAVLVTFSALGNLLGTYMIRPVVNHLADGDVRSLIKGVLVTALIYGIGAVSAYGYTQTMVKAAQQVLCDIRRDLFAHLQTLPLKFFDTNRHGDIMSYFTNDVDTISDALNNSFCHDHSELYPADRNIGCAVCLKLAAVPDCGGLLCGDVLVYPVQREAE